MSNLSVSILINNFNYAHFLGEAIDSAIGQSYSGDKVQIVVVDDGSTDHSREVIQHYAEHITPILKENGGQASAINAGFEACEGDVVCLLDADDFFFPEKVQEVAQAINNQPTAGWHFHQLTDIMGSDSSVERNSTVETNSELTDYRQIIHEGGSMPLLPATSGLSFKYEVLKEILPIPSTFRTCADAFLRLTAISDALGLLSNQELAVHRIHGNNLFEGQEKIEEISMQVDMRLSDAIKNSRPATSLFADRLFSHALGVLAAKKGWDYVLTLPEVSNYLQSLNSPGAKFNCTTRAILNWMRSLLKNSLT